MQVYCLRMHTWHQCMGRSLRRIPCHKYSYRGRFLPQRRFVRNVYNTLFQRRDLCKVNPLGIWHEAVVFFTTHAMCVWHQRDKDVMHMWHWRDTHGMLQEAANFYPCGVMRMWWCDTDMTDMWYECDKKCDAHVTHNVIRMWHRRDTKCDKQSISSTVLASQPARSAQNTNFITTSSLRHPHPPPHP